MHTLEDGVDHLESLIDLLTDLGTGEYDLTADEDQKHDLRLDHAVDQAGEQLRLVRAEVVMARSQSLEADGELDVAATHDVLDLEVGKLGIKTKLLNDTRILARSKLRVIFRFGTSYHHLA